MGQKSELSYAGSPAFCLGSLTGKNPGISEALATDSRLGKGQLPSTGDCWKDSVPCWLPQGGGPHFPLDPSDMTACGIHVGSLERGRGSTSRREARVLCKLIMKMTSPPLCHILLVRSESPHAAHKGVEDDAFLHPSGRGVSWGQQTWHGANRGIKKPLELC